MRLPLVVATFTFACVLSAGVTAPRSSAGQASSSSPRPAHKKKHRASKRQISQKAPTPDRITEIQSALARKGYYQGEPNGKWDPSTVAALQKFQSANGIDADGKLDAPTLQKLGLGSDIAGVSAPKPVTPPSSVAPAPPPSSRSTVPESNADVAVNSSAATAASKTAEH